MAQNLTVVHSVDEGETWSSPSGGTTHESLCLHIEFDGDLSDITYLDLLHVVEDWLPGGGRIINIMRNTVWSAESYGSEHPVLVITATIEKEW
jgi:hypothetical protein